MRAWFSFVVVVLCLAPSAAPGQANLPEIIGGREGTPPQTTKTANPSNYLAELSKLAPGERLLLDPGTYPRGLPVHGLNGAAGACIVIEDPATGPPAPGWSLALASLPAHVSARGLDERIGDYLAEEVRSRGIPGLTAAVVLDGEVVYIGAFGVRRLGSGEALTPEHVFHFASVSKPFVATAIVQLVEQGRVSLDDAVTKYLPYFRLSDERFRDITIRQMLNHTSGMPDVEDYEWDRPQLDEGAAERYVRSIASERLLWAPGENWRYSNMAFDALGDVVAKVSGESFEAYVAANILEPLGMDRSSFIYPEIDETLMTSGHVGEPPEVSGVYPYNRRHAPSSTLNSSVSQMTRWILVNLRRGELDGRRILRDASYDLLWTRTSETSRDGVQLGLGWFLGQREGQRTVFHSGGDTGFRSYILLLPEDAIGIVLASNWENTDTRALGLGILDIMRP